MTERPPPDILVPPTDGPAPGASTSGMVYSVPGKNEYTYLSGSGSFPASGRYRKPHGSPTAGMWTCEQFSATLPPGAHVIGKGQLPKGMIADPVSTLSGMLGSIPEPVKRFTVDVAAALVAKWAINRIWK